MTTYALLTGDAIDKLRSLRDESVHCVVTSPPYWGLRDYGVEGQIGLEESPDAWAARLVEVFREVRRVLRPEGVFWCNIGDSYWNDGAEKRDRGHGFVSGGKRKLEAAKGSILQPRIKKISGMKAKDLVGQPWLLAFALQADGWYLRSDVVWSKPNPMPESITDRPTKSHEYVFLLAKGRWSERAVRFADLPPETVHFGRNLGTSHPHVGTTGLCVRLATALFDLAQEQHDFSLPAFYAEEWKHRAQRSDSHFVASLPPNHRLAADAARFLDGDTTSKDFLREIHSRWFSLTDADHLLIRGSLSQSSLAPRVLVDRDASIAVDDAGKVCKIDLAHEQILIRTPTECRYFYDADAIREPYTAGHQDHSYVGANPAGRNRRSVWEIPTARFEDAHFATFPEKLVEPCVMAGTSEAGCCEKCGAPRVRRVEFGEQDADHAAACGADSRGEYHGKATKDYAAGKAQDPSAVKARILAGMRERRTVAWDPSCACGAATAPCTVLDPFSGSGTTGAVALRLGRSYIGIELSPVYQEIARKRLNAVASQPLLDFHQSAEEA